MKTHTRAAQISAQTKLMLRGLLGISTPKPAASSLIFGSQLATANTLLSVAMDPGGLKTSTSR
ncbi:hypothetical protein D3C84_759510 [compost metagenome]